MTSPLGVFKSKQKQDEVHFTQSSPGSLLLLLPGLRVYTDLDQILKFKATGSLQIGFKFYFLGMFESECVLGRSKKSKPVYIIFKGDRIFTRKKASCGRKFSFRHTETTTDRPVPKS